MRRRAALTAALGVFALNIQARAADEAPRDWVTPGQAEPVIRRVLETEAFLSSDEARTEPQSLGLFFKRREYQMLRGNPILGYWSESGFSWVGNKVAWQGITAGAPSCKPITEKAWNAAFSFVARKRGLVVDKSAPMKVSGACVGAVIEPTVKEPKRGVALEVRIDGPTGPLFFRFGTGKATIEDAIGASLERLLAFALRAGSDGK